MISLTEDQNNLIREIAREENISDYELEVSSASIKGDGYLGIISSVEVIGKTKKLSLILKAAETSQELRKKVLFIRKAYLREIFLYNTVFPEFERLQRQRNLQNGFRAYAKMYGYCDLDLKECIILENLKANGYKLWNRMIPMNSEHVELVFSVYGKFHALSLAMGDKKPETFKELSKHLGDIFENTYNKQEAESVLKTTFDNGFKAVEGHSNATEPLRRFSDIASNFLLEQLNIPEYNIVITHGDCWCNNMMFKYEDTENPQKPTQVCLLDWQLSRIGSPVMDLAYFFFVCSPKDVLYDFKKYLKIYHDTVTDNLRKLSCDPEKLFPYTLLEDHWKTFAKYGLYMAIFVIKLMLSDPEEVPVLDEIVKAGENIFEFHNYECLRINDYNKRIYDVVTFMSEHELI